MNVGDICTRDVAVIEPRARLSEAAKMMRERHVGDLVVMEPGADAVPLGMLTDRDIVIGVLAEDIPEPAALAVADVLVPRDLVTVEEDETIAQASRRMAIHGVRRLPVVDDRGRLVGIVTLDDLLCVLSDQLSDLADLAGAQAVRERRQRS